MAKENLMSHLTWHHSEKPSIPQNCKTLQEKNPPKKPEKKNRIVAYEMFFVHKGLKGLNKKCVF